MVEVVVTCGNRKAISGGMGTDDPFIFPASYCRNLYDILVPTLVLINPTLVLIN